MAPMTMSYLKISPVKTSAVQKEVPSGSRLSAKKPPVSLPGSPSSPPTGLEFFRENYLMIS